MTQCKCGPCETVPHDSDCAVHNEPATPNGDCDCKGGWISVADRLPPPGFEVQIFWTATRCKYEGQSVASLQDGQWSQSNPCNGGTLWNHLVKVTHWQPLPKPPTS